ncbi:hypothetical protein MPSEU_000008300 [Mayamaea pseudoterrestris]|nr:hypothetical protein MPSEU_000008300 [Mayamaea pseudoterrestris]
MQILKTLSLLLLAHFPASIAWVQPRPIHTPKCLHSSSKPTSSINAIVSSPNPSTSTNFLDSFTKSLVSLTTTGNTDVRGKFLDHLNATDAAADQDATSFPSMLQQMYASTDSNGNASSAATTGILSPLHAFCLGHALGRMLLADRHASGIAADDESTITVVLGRDPRPHGSRLASALAKGMVDAGSSVDADAASARISVVHQRAKLASTPSMAWIVAQRQADAAVMVTASHLPVDKNGFKFYTSTGWSLARVNELGRLAVECAQMLWDNQQQNNEQLSSLQSKYQLAIDKIKDEEWVGFFPEYTQSLKDAVLRETQGIITISNTRPLDGLCIVVNSGHGSGGFLGQVLSDLGADVSKSIHLTPNGAFPAGVPNPENKKMVVATMEQCQTVRADLGIMLDTDADRCGFIVPALDVGSGKYEALNRNRLIALLGVAFSKQTPGCAIVTDSVTSEGLSTFLTSLGLQHVRYLKGYANVINKAKELTEAGAVNAEVAIETSGHCAMRENNYIDDGTYTAVKVVSMLAREAAQAPSSSPLLKLIEQLQEMPVAEELRLRVHDESLDTMRLTFGLCKREIERLAGQSYHNWELDSDNLEGIRIRFGSDQFFMLRKSLHDPIISLQIEALSKKSAEEYVMMPLWNALQSVDNIREKLNMDVLRHT